jgi:DMSO reductase anchor subunit
MEFIFGSIFFLIGGIVWLIPLIVILSSSRTSGGEKAAWVLAVIFISWFAWIFYFLLAPLNDKRNHARY